MLSVSSSKERAAKIIESIGVWRSQFDEWTKESAISASYKESKFLGGVTKANEIIRHLSAEQKKYIKETTQLQEEYAQEEQEELILKQRIEKLVEKAEQLPRIVQQNQDKVELTSKDVSHLRTIHQDLVEEKKRQTTILQNEIAKFKDALGLEFKRIASNRLRFSFRYIDPNDINREFYFTIFIDPKSKKYSIEECQPQLPSDQVDQCIRKLNRSNNISLFVSQMRRGFVMSLADKENRSGNNSRI